MTHVIAHIFSNTGEAYDATQCSDLVRTGDLLLIPSERVVGVAYTWPFAVTVERGALHGTITGSLQGIRHSFAQEEWNPNRINILDGIEHALDLARQLNWETCE